ncbi:MAG: TIGR04100 family radical SAM protein [Lachnospiraceae bacterium]|nr:TIGR04100 family radical SAM protein [Lachnospiraceae bacterium]
MADIIYTYHNNVYFNITNRCTCKCVFCIRDEKETLGEAKEMWHDHNPSFEEIKAAIDDFDFAPYTEAVFCGYGEPTCSYNNLIAAAKYMRENNPHVSLRLNTNGLGELYNKKPIVEELAQYIDAVSISLNAPNAVRYQEVTRPCYENAFKDMLAFAEKSKSAFKEVKFSVVSIISEEEIADSQKLADEMGIPLRVRIYS